MKIIFADKYKSVDAAIKHAVCESAGSEESVTILAKDITDIEKILFQKCHDSTLAGEYWGLDEDGKPWKIRVFEEVE